MRGSSFTTDAVLNNFGAFCRYAMDAMQPLTQHKQIIQSRSLTSRSNCLVSGATGRFSESTD
jgi:hypothetical protein